MRKLRLIGALEHVTVSRFVITSTSVSAGHLSVMNITNRSQWSSGSMTGCGARGPGIESRCGQLCIS